MKQLTKIALSLSLICASVSVFSAEKLNKDSTYQQAYALYLLYHPEKNTKSIVQQYEQDYANLFKENKKANIDQFVQYEQSRLEPVLKQRREMSLKQAYVRYGILDKNRDQKLTLKEFQETGVKTFDEFDENKDGIVNAEDAKLNSANKGTHDGFRIKLPISLPMASNGNEFIQQYGKDKNYVTLGDYLTARDQQFFATDTSGDYVVTEHEYVNEFMQRFDKNIETGKTQMQELAAQQFKVIAKGKVALEASDITKFAKQVNQSISK